MGGTFLDGASPMASCPRNVIISGHAAPSGDHWAHKSAAEIVADINGMMDRLEAARSVDLAAEVRARYAAGLASDARVRVICPA